MRVQPEVRDAPQPGRDEGLPDGGARVHKLPWQAGWGAEEEDGEEHPRGGSHQGGEEIHTGEAGPDPPGEVLDMVASKTGGMTGAGLSSLLREVHARRSGSRAFAKALASTRDGHALMRALGPHGRGVGKGARWWEGRAGHVHSLLLNF